MNKYMLNLALTAVVTATTACSEAIDPVLTQKDWDNTDNYIAISDESAFDTYYKPMLGYVGDPMPFYDEVNKEFKVMYLQDFRPNPTGCYHPIYGVSTTDGSSYTSLGELIQCGGIDEQDAALGTGSTIYSESEQLYYTFYTGNKYLPTSSQNGQVVMYATSKDFKTWTKNTSFRLKGNDYGYDKSNFRDPFVFKGDDNLYHMIVSTYKSGKGTLAEFTSADLKSWKSAGDFMNMMWDRFYECPDVFKMGDWWYLVYSDQTSFMRMVQYFKGRTLDELKACTAGDAGKWPDYREGKLDGRAYYAGKTASDGVNRYIWGWCPTRAGQDNANVGENEPEWGGNLVMHKLVQHSDGTLAFAAPDALSNKYTTEQSVKIMHAEGDVNQGTSSISINEGGKAIFNRLQRHNKISFDVTTSSKSDRFAISFVNGTDSKSWYSVRVHGDENKANFEKEGEDAEYLLDAAFSAPEDGVYHVTIYTDQSVCVTYINDELAFTNRIYSMQKNPWALTAVSGNMTVSNLSVKSY